MLSLKEKVVRAENAMMKGEKILYQGAPKKSAVVLKSVFNNMFFFVLIWMIFDGVFLGLVFGLSGGDMSWVMYIIIIGFFCIHLMPVWVWLYGIISSLYKAKKLYYIVTNFRVMSVNNKDYFDSLYYKDIDSVELIKNKAEKMTQTTTVKIGFGGGEISAPTIYNRKAKASKFMYLQGIESGADVFEIIYARRGKVKEKLIEFDKNKTKTEEISSKKIKKIKKKVK